MYIKAKLLNNNNITKMKEIINILFHIKINYIKFKYFCQDIIICIYNLKEFYSSHIFYN